MDEIFLQGPELDAAVRCGDMGGIAFQAPLHLQEVMKKVLHIVDVMIGLEDDRQFVQIGLLEGQFFEIIEITRCHNDLNMGIELMHLAHQLKTVHVGHHKIGNEDVNGKGLHHLKGLLGRRGGMALIGLPRKETLPELEHHRIVINNKDPLFGHGGSPLFSLL